MGTWTTIVTAIGAVLAVWSISWIVRAQRTGSDERSEEERARARVAQGQGWDGPRPPHAFSDAELAALARAQAPLTLEEAGVYAVPRGPKSRRRRHGRTSGSRSS